MTVAESVAALGYQAGWSMVKRLPDATARRAFMAAGRAAGRRDGGPEQLRRNLARVVGVNDPAAVDDDLVAESMASYARYWCEAFRMPNQNLTELAASVQVSEECRDNFWSAYNKGRGVVFALPHSGNWDMAGVWLVSQTGQFSTVAERLKPESLFNKFVWYRETLGFEIFPLSGGERPPMGELAARLREGKVVCLLGERDLNRHGVPVEFFGERTLFPAGAAKLAIDTGAELMAVHHWFGEGTTSHISCPPPLDTSGGIAATTQLIADQFERDIAAHPTDWHMLQPLWESDWSDARRDRLGPLTHGNPDSQSRPPSGTP